MTTPCRTGGPAAGPNSYSSGTIIEAIARAENDAGGVTVGSVKETLFTKLGVKKSVRPESLDATARAHLEEHQRRRDEACIAKLPDTVRAQLDEAAAAVARLLAVTSGREAERVQVSLAVRLDEEARLRLELIRRLSEVEGERDQALEQVRACEKAAEAKQAQLEARNRHIAKLERKLIRLQGIIEGQRSQVSSGAGIDALSLASGAATTAVGYIDQGWVLCPVPGRPVFADRDTGA